MQNGKENRKQKRENQDLATRGTNVLRKQDGMNCAGCLLVGCLSTLGNRCGEGEARTTQSPGRAVVKEMPAHENTQEHSNSKK